MTDIRDSFELMIIDDEPGDVELIRIAIADGEFRCDTVVARDGVEAMELLRRDGSRKPNLILLDLNMPRMNGREFLAEIKADPRLACIPVVVLTTSQIETDVLASYEHGAAGFVTKPVDVEQLFKAIHSIQEYWLGVVRPPCGKACG